MQEQVEITTGHIIFAILFLIGFAVALFFAYRKDFKLNKKLRKGTSLMSLGLFLFLVLVWIAVQVIIKSKQ